MTAPPALALDALTCRIGPRTLFCDLSFTLEAGARASLLGPSGSGKTTLLRTIAGLRGADSGRILLGGKLATDGANILLPPWRRGVHLVFQDLGLWPTRTVLQNVADARRAAGLADPVATATALLEELGLGSLLKRRPASLSGGEARRLAFARALAVEPPLLLLDEPFAHLDEAARDKGFELLDTLLARTPAAVLMVTHRDEEAARLGGEVLRLPEEARA